MGRQYTCWHSVAITGAGGEARLAAVARLPRHPLDVAWHVNFSSCFFSGDTAVMGDARCTVVVSAGGVDYRVCVCACASVICSYASKAMRMWWWTCVYASGTVHARSHTYRCTHTYIHVYLGTHVHAYTAHKHTRVCVCKCVCVYT